MNAKPVFIESFDDKGCSLTPIDIKPGDPRDEDWLQELLYRHPELLPVDEFDEAFAPAIPIGREVPSGRGPIDNLYISPSGGITIVETKLWKNPEKHRTVVAQIIDYAKELASWHYDDLAEAVLTASRCRGETDSPSLEQKVDAALKDQSRTLIDFQESVETNLQDGNFLLLIVGDRIAPNMAMLTQAIQSAPGLGFRLGLVEMRLYTRVTGRDWPLVVVPDVVGRIVEKTRAVVRCRQERPEVLTDIEDDDSAGGRPGKIDLEAFFSEIPKDLVTPFREAVEKWQAMGGSILFTNRMMFFTAELNGEPRRVIRCQVRHVRLVTRDLFNEWSRDDKLYQAYLESLESSPVVSNLARSGKQWVRYDKIAPDDLRVLLQAGLELVERIRGAEQQGGE